jgi:uncharacterized membrane protein/protein-disulfide isomerase
MAELELTEPRGARRSAAGERERQMQRRVFAAIVVLTAVGLAASAALLVDYLRPIPLFCSESGGCGQLRRSVYSHVLGLPTPAIGLAGYFVLSALTLARGHVARFLHLVAATFGALFAGYFLFIQFYLSTFCAYCLTVDLSTIVLLSLVLLRVRTEADSPGTRPSLGVAGVLAFVTVVPFLSNALIKPPIPPVIAAEMAKTPRGQVTIVDFIDFECPYCRHTAADFQPTLDQYRGRFRLVRKQMPLVRMHPHAETAARAAVCAETLGKGDEMAAALISAPVEELTDEGCSKIAVGIGLDPAAFRACLASPATQQKLQSDEAAFKGAHGHGLPLIWINDQMIEGQVGPDKLREAMEKALGEVGG